MKKRRTSIAAFLLLSSVALGVGYAAVSQTLEFRGTIGANTTTQFDVAFDGIEEQGGTKFSSLLDTSGPRYAQLSFTGFTNVGDKCVTHLKVKNNTPASAGLSASLGALNTTAPASQDYFAISYDWGEAKTTLASGESTYIVITVELTKARIDETQAAGTSFDVSFVATAVYA